MKNTAKFGRNLITYMPVQYILNVFQLLGLFNCRELAIFYHRTFVTETCKQCPETTRRRLCYEKERIVVERANDDLC